MAQRGLRTEGRKLGDSVREGVLLRVVGGLAGSSAQAKCDQTPVISIRPARWAVAAASSNAVQLGTADAVARQAGVDLELDSRPCSGSGPDDGVELLDRRRRHLDVRVDGRRKIGVGRVEPAQHGTAVTGAAQVSGLLERRDTEPLGAGLAGGRAIATAPCPYASALTTVICAAVGATLAKRARFAR